MNRWRRQFFLSLSQILGAGVTLARAFEILIEQESNQAITSRLKIAHHSLITGHSLSASMRGTSLISQYEEGLLKAAESSGKLLLVLQRIATFHEERTKLEQRIKSGLLYPVTTLAVGFLIVLFLVPMIVKDQLALLGSLGVDLPAPTLILMMFAEGLSRWWVWFVMILGPILLAAWGRSLAQNEKFRCLVGQFVLTTRVAVIYRNLGSSRFALPFCLGLQAGIPLEKALNLALQASGNAVLQERGSQIFAEVASGLSLWQAMERTEFFSPTFLSLVRVGEDSGRLPEMLRKAIEIAEMELEESIDLVSSLCEPAAVLAMGGLVAFFALAVLMPTIRMVGSLT